MVVREICAIVAPAIRRCLITAEPQVQSHTTVREIRYAVLIAAPLLHDGCHCPHRSAHCHGPCV
jgi:hypothetical protein